MWHLDLHPEKLELKGLFIFLARFSPWDISACFPNSCRKAVVAIAPNCIQKNKYMKSYECSFNLGGEGVGFGFGDLVFWGEEGCGCAVTFRFILLLYVFWIVSTFLHLWPK